MLFILTKLALSNFAKKCCLFLKRSLNLSRAGHLQTSYGSPGDAIRGDIHTQAARGLTLFSLINAE